MNWSLAKFQPTPSLFILTSAYWSEDDGLDDNPSYVFSNIDDLIERLEKILHLHWVELWNAVGLSYIREDLEEIGDGLTDEYEIDIGLLYTPPYEGIIEQFELGINNYFFNRLILDAINSASKANYQFVNMNSWPLIEIMKASEVTGLIPITSPSLANIIVKGITNRFLMTIKREFNNPTNIQKIEQARRYQVNPENEVIFRWGYTAYEYANQYESSISLQLPRE